MSYVIKSIDTETITVDFEYTPLSARESLTLPLSDFNTESKENLISGIETRLNNWVHNLLTMDNNEKAEEEKNQSIEKIINEIDINKKINIDFKAEDPIIEEINAKESENATSK